MTNAEAIETLRANYPDACYEQLREAVDAAIEVLKAQDAAGDTISRQAAIDTINALHEKPNAWLDSAVDAVMMLPPAQPDGYVKIPETGIDDLSDGFHTFRQLYYQRMMLFATIVKQNREKAWKSLRHEDGELCFGGGWFIVGIDTPEGSYTYHYEDNFYSLFDCVELEYGKHWDGHTEKDVTRLLTLPSEQPEQRLSCKNCVHLGHGYMMPCKNCKRNQMLPDWYEVETERKKND